MTIDCTTDNPDILDAFMQGRCQALEDVIVGLFGFITVDDATKLRTLTLKQIDLALRNIFKCADCKSVDEVLYKAIYDYQDGKDIYEKAMKDTKRDIARRAIELKLINIELIAKLTGLDISEVEKIEDEVYKATKVVT